MSCWFLLCLLEFEPYEWYPQETSNFNLEQGFSSGSVVWGLIRKEEESLRWPASCTVSTEMQSPQESWAFCAWQLEKYRAQSTLCLMKRELECFVLVVLCFKEVPCSPRRSPAHYVNKDSRELLIFQLLPPECSVYVSLGSNPGLLCACSASTQSTETYSQLLDKISILIGANGLKELRIIQVRVKSVRRPIIWRHIPTNFV